MAVVPGKRTETQQHSTAWAAMHFSTTQALVPHLSAARLSAEAPPGLPKNQGRQGEEQEEHSCRQVGEIEDH